MRTIPRLVVSLSVAMCAAAPAAAQQTAASTSARWAPWMGCWHVAEESIDDGAQLLESLSGTSGRTDQSRRAVVCVTPSEDGGATITTRVNEAVVLTETIVADGTQRPINEPGCTGWQRAEWSALGARVFARAEITCSDQSPRVVSGMAAMVAGPMWLDAQMIESEGRKSLRVRRYERTAQQPASPLTPSRDAATTPLGRKLTLNEIKEASGKVPVEILQAAVLELGTGGYDLKAKQLIELDAAGVPDGVIDLMIAMSFPKRFVVERASPSGGGGLSGFGGMGIMGDPYTDVWPYLAMWPYAGMWPYMGDYYYSSFYRAYYSPFGYRTWGYFDPYVYYGQPGFVVVDPGGGGAVPPVSSGEGRVVDGRGYTRIRRNEPAPPTRVNGNNGGWDTASAGNNGNSGSSSSGSGSGVSSGGYSSGGSSSGGDRVAIPRPPGK